ncbi:NADPH-dependent FMN reductase [Streptomyces palmae]|uniref:NAD(P)H-dependent oxidoreductase n=1 Tax=Streptomyces palmae TaxID=1701085 RepID=A0A4Z0HCL8_9ACTN|nr:NADPH-dependent FMN reductase [Streptomyces palmae]TGB08695.1 NAD(P)H-dependent oxidoreductase [Streptomyces palmae]
MSSTPLILLLSGSLRSGSSNESVLRTAEAVAPASVRTVRYSGLAELPHFNPDHDTDPLPDPVVALRTAIAEASALLICAPEYAGTLPGSFKNLLDWTVGGTEICDKPAAWVTAAAPGRGQGAEATLRTVLTYTGAEIVESACVRIPVSQSMMGDDGLIAEPGARARISAVLAELAEYQAPFDA